MPHFEQKRNIDLTAKDSIGWTPFRNEPLILMLWMDSMNACINGQKFFDSNKQ